MMIKGLGFLSLALAVQTVGAQERLPFQKKQITLKSPTSYEKRILRYDQKSGEPVYYDPKPTIVLLNVKSGTYALRWIGYDGKEKTIVYQRHDAINAVISATVSRTASGQYLYVYTIKNLPSSGQHLSQFALQTFASDAQAAPIADGYFGPFSTNREMKEGNWIGVGLTDRAVMPGQSIEFKVRSYAPPGVVECRIAGGRFGLKGVGEEMPQDLENALPIYEDWPKGYTVGPIDYLKRLTSGERIKYLAERLALFRKLGWMTTNVTGWYERTLRNNKVDELFKRAEKDFRARNITSEIYDLIQSIK